MPLFGFGDAHTTTTIPLNKLRHLEKGGEGKKFLSSSWHDKSVCISTLFITSHPRQRIEFQKPINKGDVHSAWQLSQTSVPLSFAQTLPHHQHHHHPSFSLPLSLKWAGKEMKIKGGEGEKKRRWDAFMLWLFFHWTDKGKHQDQGWMWVLFFC